MLIREAKLEDASAIARVHVDSWRTTYQGIIPDSFLAGLSYERSETMWQDILSKHIDFTYVVEEEDTLVGFANGGREREGNTDYTGEIFAIYLLKEFQRKGIGRALVASLTTRLIQEGMRSTLVWVLEKNSACRFYEALGGKLVSQKVMNIGGADLVVVSYGWRDANTLIKNAKAHTTP